MGKFLWNWLALLDDFSLRVFNESVFHFENLECKPSISLRSLQFEILVAILKIQFYIGTEL